MAVFETVLAALAIPGSLGGVYLGGWLSAKTQLRTTRATVEGQVAIAAAARQATLFDKMAAASSAMIEVLLRQPYAPTSIFYGWDGSAFIQSLNDWFAEFRTATAPLFAYGTDEIAEALRSNLETISTCTAQIQYNVNDLLELQRGHQGRQPEEPQTAEIRRRELEWRGDFGRIWDINREITALLRRTLRASRQ